MATTLADLRAQCRAFLADSAIWPDAKLDRFINDGIRAYSNELPRRMRQVRLLSTGVQAYDLPGGHGFLRLVGVECPAGQDPPSFLRRARSWSEFYADGETYIVQPPLDSVPAESDTAVGQLVIARAVATGESAVVTYDAVHRLPSADTDIVTVPEAHHEAIIAFVDFRAHWERESNETHTAASSTLILSQLGENGRRAWNRWREVMRRLAPVDEWDREPIDWGGIGL